MNIKNITKYLHGDRAIWNIAIFFSCISIFAVYSASSSLAYRSNHFTTEYFLLKHSTLIILSLLMMFFVHNIDYRYFAGFAKIGMIISIPLLVITWRYGLTLNQASRWITLPFINKSFQPSDLAQLSLVTYIATHLAKHNDQVHDFYKVLFPVIKWCVAVFSAIAFANASRSIIVILVSINIMFLANVPMKKLFSMLIGVSIVAIVAISLGQREKTVINRLQAFFSGNVPFQTEQSYIAIALGGVYGNGPGNSNQRNIIPHPYSDFIYATLIEEYGLIGAIIILVLYLTILYKTIRFAYSSENIYRSLLAMGIASNICIQAFINIAVVVGLCPVTGVTLPFISMGGTSLIFTGISFGMLLSLSRDDHNINAKRSQRFNTLNPLVTKQFKT